MCSHALYGYNPCLYSLSMMVCAYVINACGDRVESLEFPCESDSALASHQLALVLIYLCLCWRTMTSL